jgi:hypothetical protein
MNAAQKRNYKQYLERYAEPEARALHSVLLSDQKIIPKNLAVASIPLCREGEQIAGCFATLLTSAAQTPALVIFVVNNRASSDSDLKKDNQDTLKFLLNKVTPVKIRENIVFGQVNSSFCILVVDRASPGHELPEDQGVGLARKIGCDLATVLMCEGEALDEFIRNTDGDARVSEDFFKPITKGPAAGIYPFRHEAKGDGVNAVLQYEAYLHYYVRAMAAAGSSYAFHTIGSTIACSVMSYIACRGFPKRDAGEDFYLLNKLAKDGDVILLDRGPITLVARDSDRVPFGTGAACRRIEGLVMNGGVYKVYHPRCFLLLKIWLKTLTAILESWSSSEHAHDAGIAFVEGKWEGFIASAKAEFPDMKRDFFLLLEAQLSLKAGLLSVLSKSRKPAVIAQHARIWFDGFRTMRFLNLARDHEFGEIPATELGHLFTEQQVFH